MDNHPHTTEEYLVIACRQYAESHKDQFMPRATLWQAADTIERLQGLNTDLDLLSKKRKTLLDAALAEVERLQKEVER